MLQLKILRAATRTQCSQINKLIKKIQHQSRLSDWPSAPDFFVIYHSIRKVSFRRSFAAPLGPCQAPEYRRKSVLSRGLAKWKKPTFNNHNTMTNTALKIPDGELTETGVTNIIRQDSRKGFLEKAGF